MMDDKTNYTNENNLQFKTLGIEGVQKLISWAKDEGWNPGIEDAKAFYATDPNAFIGCFLKDEMIGGGAIVSYEGNFGFMGLFILKSEFRSHGFGKKLWYLRRDTLLKRLKKGASIGMDAALEMQPFYQKGGFQTAFGDKRYEKKGSTYQLHPAINSIQAKDFSTIVNYDKTCFGVSRERFLKHWFQISSSKRFQYLENNQLKGYAMIRKTEYGYKVCPLFADSFEIAEELYKACLNATEGESLFIDVPLINKSALALVQKYEAEHVFDCIRMYYGEAPKIELNKVYGITTLELG